MPETVVANAGPLMVLAKLNLLHLLRQLYGQVQLARSVYDEVVTEGMRQGAEDAHTLQLFLSQEGWRPTEVQDVPNSLMSSHLDQGERESIALTLGRGSLLLVDEERGRAVARQQGVRARGTLGVLIQAYRCGLVTADQLRFYFRQIEERPDIWISPTLCRRLLQEVPG